MKSTVKEDPFQFRRLWTPPPHRIRTENVIFNLYLACEADYLPRTPNHACTPKFWKIIFGALSHLCHTREWERMVNVVELRHQILVVWFLIQIFPTLVLISWPLVDELGLTFALTIRCTTTERSWKPLWKRHVRCGWTLLSLMQCSWPWYLLNGSTIAHCADNCVHNWNGLWFSLM